jgi:hypothetical protein
MTTVQKSRVDPASQPRTIPERTRGNALPPLPSLSVPSDSIRSKVRSGQLNLDAFSPVNQNGSFEFDRVLKSGYVEKRTRKTKVQLNRPLF